MDSALDQFPTKSVEIPQVPAIRSANKMWAKDPIYPRKTLYIPLDACKQPPSREVEFVQKSGQDEVQMFFRDTSVPTAPSFAQMLNSNSTSHNGGRTRSASLRLEALAELPRPLTPYHDSDPSSQADSPITSQRSSFSQSRPPPASAHFSYLSSTNSEYDEMEDEAYRKRTWSGTGTPDDPPLKSLSVKGEIAASDVSSAAEHASPTATIQQKTLQIVQIPGTNIKKSASVPSGIARTRGNSPLISVDNLQKPGPSMTSPPPSAAVVSVSSTSIGTPSLSNDRLSVVSGVPANLRQRPRSPFDGDTTPFPSMSTGSTLPSELPRPSARTRKISKEVVPSSKNNSSLPRLPGSLGKYITSAGGMLSSIMGDKGDSGWLATSELETEMQMAREYQSRHQQRASLSNDRMIHSRSRSQASLRETSFNTDFGRRAPSLSSDHL